MIRPRSSSRAGKPRSRDVRGETFGPYRVDSYVGDDPMTSIYVRLVCKFGCGHTITPNRHSITGYRGKKCGGCKRRADNELSVGDVG